MNALAAGRRNQILFVVALGSICMDYFAEWRRHEDAGRIRMTGDR
jgi:hypothetical protein